MALITMEEDKKKEQEILEQ